MTLQDRQQAIAAAKAEMERQKAREQALLDQIIEVVHQHYPAGTKRRYSDWAATIIISLADTAGVRWELIGKALKMPHNSLYYHRGKRLADARRALQALDAVQKELVNKASTR